MVYLNGDYIPIAQACISVLDRGFLFSDGIYEVIPVYSGRLFRLSAHLKRLEYSLYALGIKNPYSQNKWQSVLTKLIAQQREKTLSLYIQITRGIAEIREHISKNELTPTIFIQALPLKIKTFDVLKKGYHAITDIDTRWTRCDIKSIALLANVLHLQKAKEKNVEEVILLKNALITEGASSNVFMVKNNIVITHPKGRNILSGVTRDLVIESVKYYKLKMIEKPFDKKALFDADEVWISSSTREIMPIIYIDNHAINGAKVGALWQKIYQHFKKLKDG